MSNFSPIHRTLRYSVTAEELSDSRMSVWDYLRQKAYSTAVIRSIKNTPEGILLNGSEVFTSALLHAGDELIIHILEQEGSPEILPVPLPLSIIYEDEDLMIIDKPAGMPIHPSIGNTDNTLANALMAVFEKRKLIWTCRIINRLDRDTSGLVIAAKHKLSGGILSRMAADRQIHREYLAVVCGHTPPSGDIEAPIAREEGSIITRCVDFEHGAPSDTHFKTLYQNDRYSLLSIHLGTGRTHQIRVHMKYLGFPLPGDYLYNPDFTDISRQALHSHRLTFKHPITGDTMDFISPLPEDMKKLVEH